MITFNSCSSKNISDNNSENKFGLDLEFEIMLPFLLFKSGKWHFGIRVGLGLVKMENNESADDGRDSHRPRVCLPSVRG